MKNILQQEVINIQNSIEKLRETYAGQTGVNLILDGVIVNALGKLFAMEHLGVKLTLNDGIHNGIDEKENLVRITTTQGNNIILKEGVNTLIVLQLQRGGIFRVVYNGSGLVAWNRGNAPRGNTRRISLHALENFINES